MQALIDNAAQPTRFLHDPVQTTKTSVHGAINMLGLAKRVRAKILQASTSEVYGDPNVHPQTEDYWGHVNPIGLRSCYDEGKRCAETLFFDYWRQHKLNIKVARIFNTYGPRMHPHDGRVVSNFIIQALLNRDITVYGDGSQTRSFCYADDLIDGLARLMGSADDVVGPINIGNPVEFTMLQLADLVREITGSRSHIVHQPLPKDDPRQRQPDISKAQAILGWKPATPLKVGLEKTIAYFETLLHEPGIRDAVDNGVRPYRAEAYLLAVLRRITLHTAISRCRYLARLSGRRARSCMADKQTMLASMPQLRLRMPLRSVLLSTSRRRCRFTAYA